MAHYVGPLLLGSFRAQISLKAGLEMCHPVVCSVGMMSMSNPDYERSP